MHILDLNRSPQLLTSPEPSLTPAPAVSRTLQRPTTTNPPLLRPQLVPEVPLTLPPTPPTPSLTPPRRRRRVNARVAGHACVVQLGALAAKPPSPPEPRRQRRPRCLRAAVSLAASAPAREPAHVPRRLREPPAPLLRRQLVNAKLEASVAARQEVARVRKRPLVPPPPQPLLRLANANREASVAAQAPVPAHRRRLPRARKCLFLPLISVWRWWSSGDGDRRISISSRFRLDRRHPWSAH